MPPVLIPIGILDASLLDTSGCTHPAGHCFGSDGGSGIPNNLKVAEGRGGEQEAWRLNASKTQILSRDVYAKCQYCQKYTYVRST